MATDILKVNCMRLIKMQQDSYGSRTFKDQEIITDEDGILSATDFVHFFFPLEVILNNLLEQQKKIGLQAI